VRAEIVGDAFVHSEIYENLRHLCDGIGGRMSGMESGDRAQAYALRKFEEYGLQGVHKEAFPLQAWRRGQVAVRVYGPSVQRSLAAVALGNVGSTPGDGLDAELIDVGHGDPAEFEALGPEIKGKITLVDEGSLPGKRSLHRSEKAALSAKYEALAMLHIAQGPDGLPRTGTACLGGLADIAAAAIPEEDGAWVRRLLDRGHGLRVLMTMTNEAFQAEAANIVGDIPGSASPQEVVLVGAHLDSWDLGTGFVDNGTGVGVVLEVARLLGGVNERPKRTIRCVLFMAEELGSLGSQAYVDRHSDELDDLAMAVNLDMVGTPRGYAVHGHPEANAFLGSLAEKLCGFDLSPEISNGVGLNSDHVSFLLRGVPTMTVNSDLENNMGRHYHTATDTFDKIVRKSLVECSAVVAITLFELADAEDRIAQRLSRDQLRDLLVKNNLREALEASGLWSFGD
jgi:hypothetical protein